MRLGRGRIAAILPASGPVFWRAAVHARFGGVEAGGWRESGGAEAGKRTKNVGVRACQKLQILHFLALFRAHKYAKLREKTRSFLIFRAFGVLHELPLILAILEPSRWPLCLRLFPSLMRLA